MAVFGGTASLISTWLIHRAGHVVRAPAYYLIAMALVSLGAAFFVRSGQAEMAKERDNPWP